MGENGFLTCGKERVFELTNQSLASCDKMRVLEQKGINIEELEELQKRINIEYPWNSDYYWKRENYNKRNLSYPIALVYPENEEQIKEILQFVKKYSIEFTLRSGGHSYENLSLCSGFIIDFSRMKNIDVMSEIKQVKVGAGIQIDELIKALKKYDLVLPTGTCPNVGITGLTLGGGIGLLLRKYGLTCDNLVSLTMVLTNGQIVSVSPVQYNDLFWASRGGGGGNFGCVVDLTFKVYYHPNVSWFDITYERQNFAQVFDFWQKWAPYVDNNLSTVVHYNNSPQLLKIEGLFLGTNDDLTSIISPLFHFNYVNFNLYTGSYYDAAFYFATFPSHPFFKAKSDFIQRNLSSQAIDILSYYLNIPVESLGSSSDNPIDFGLYIAAFGGFPNSIPSSSTAFPHRNSLFWIQYIVHWSSPFQQDSCISWIRSLYNHIRPFVSSTCYVNCPDLDLFTPFISYYGSNLSRLRLIKSKYDPSNLLHFPQSIPPLF